MRIGKAGLTSYQPDSVLRTVTYAQWRLGDEVGIDAMADLRKMVASRQRDG